MEEEVTGGGGRLGAKKIGEGEVDFKEKAGTAWSHNYLNQKPWHPLSYPNQRRKWIAEQTQANHLRRQEEVAREFAQEQEFLRQASLFSKQEKEKMEIMKAVSFMYVRPPGYNAESAKAAELADEKRANKSDYAQGTTMTNTSTTVEKGYDKKNSNSDSKMRPKDVFGRALPTEKEFEILKNAPRIDTGVPVRIKPFAVEIRNVRCIRCGNFGHQSGDRECPLKDVVMPNEESRLKRDDPLSAITAPADVAERWELKQKPGLSPPRGGFKPDDPNQQILADDIFDEYGGFLGDTAIPTLISNFSEGKTKGLSKSKHKARHTSRYPHKKYPSPSYSDSKSEDTKSRRADKNQQLSDIVCGSIRSRDSSKKFKEKKCFKQSSDSDKYLKRIPTHQSHHGVSSSDEYSTEETKKCSSHLNGHNSDSFSSQRDKVGAKKSRRCSKRHQRKRRHGDSDSDSFVSEDDKLELKKSRCSKRKQRNSSSNSDDGIWDSHHAKRSRHRRRKY